jgi:hypothetical protein
LPVDQWNERLSNLVTRALPVNQQNAEAVSLAGSAVAAGVVDMKPADPIEGVLISQIVVANEAALSMYQRAWAALRMNISKLIGNMGTPGADGPPGDDGSTTSIPPRSI